MNKFYGKVGYLTDVETSPGIFSRDVIEKEYYGDLIKYNSKWDRRDTVINGINLSSTISILADPFVVNNFQKIIYVEWMGQKWTVTNVEPRYPRLLLSVGGEYKCEIV